jgi:hypothetical protein
LTAVYSPLIDILVAGIEAVLSLIPVSKTAVTANAAFVSNPHKGRAHVSSVKDSVSQWRAVVKANPALVAASI